MRERRLPHAGERRLGAIESAKAARRPKGMDHGRRQSESVSRSILLDDHQQVILDVQLAALDQQPLGVQPPEHVVALERGDQALRVVHRKLGPFARLPVLGDDAVDAAVGLVAQRRLVRGALARLVPLGRRVVLNDEVVPVDGPDLPVGADLGQDRRGPLIVARHEVPGVVRAEVGAVGMQREGGDEVAGRLGDERRAIPVMLRERAGGVERRAGAGGEAAVPVDLADVLGDREEPIRVGHVREHGRGHPLHRLVIPIRDRHVDARAAVGG